MSTFLIEVCICFIGFVLVMGSFFHYKEIENTGCGIISVSHTPTKASLRTLVMLKLWAAPLVPHYSLYCKLYWTLYCKLYCKLYSVCTSHWTLMRTALHCTVYFTVLHPALHTAHCTVHCTAYCTALHTVTAVHYTVPAVRIIQRRQCTSGQLELGGSRYALQITVLIHRINFWKT